MAAFIDPFARFGKSAVPGSAPIMPRRTGIAATTFMMIVGAPEIVAELIGPFKPSLAATGWPAEV